MKKIRSKPYVSPLYLDLLSMIIIIGLNPISYFICFSPNIFTSDTIAYVTMARDFFSKGLLYLSSWGHIDNGLILPPLYPFLIACGRFFSLETLNVAEYVSSICALMSSVLIFLYLKKMTNRIMAVLMLILIQINYYYFLIAMRPLSEATFLMTLSCTMYFMITVINGNLEKAKKRMAFLAGLACCLVFLARQIGIIVSLFAAIICTAQWLTVSGRERKISNINNLFMLLGWLIVFAPYAIILYSQTGHHPFTQGFKKYEYTVTVKDPELLKEIEENKILPVDLLKQIENAPNSDYGVIYAERRQMRKLLPDSSEMFSYVNIGIDEEKGFLARAISNIIDLKHYLIRLYNNIKHLSSSLGNVPMILFFLACLSSFLIKNRKIGFPARVLLPFLIIIYLLTVSSLTDKINRYIYILFPFCLMHICIESFICFNAMMGVFKLKKYKLVLPIVIFSVILLTTPRYYTGLIVIPKAEGIESRYHYLKDYLNGAPVFSLLPYYSYIAGGTFRILPNDSLDKVASYGKKTGVQWLLIVHTKGAENELKFYNNAKWYFDLSEKRYPNLVKFRIGTTDRLMALYEIL